MKANIAMLLFVLLPGLCVLPQAKRLRGRVRSRRPTRTASQRTLGNATQEKYQHDIYNAVEANWGFRVTSNSATARGEQHHGPGSAGAKPLLRKGNRTAVGVTGRAGAIGVSPAAAREATKQTAQRKPSTKTRQALQDALKRHNSSFSLSEDFLERYLASSAMEDLLSGRRRGSSRGGSRSTTRRKGSTAAQEAAARRLAAEAGRRLVHTAVGSLSACVSQWGLSDRFDRPSVRPPALHQMPPKCSRKLNVLLLLNPPGGRVADGGQHDPAEPRGPRNAPPSKRKGPWWQRPSLLRGRVVAAQLKAEGHRPVILDGARILDDPSRKEFIMSAHTNRSLDACICVGAPCHSDMLPAARLCHLIGITVIHDPADEDRMEHILSLGGSVADAVLGSSRLMQAAIAAEAKGKQGLQVPTQHNNYARVRQTPEQAAKNRVRRVVVQVMGAETEGEAGRSSTMAAVQQLEERNGWKVIAGLQLLQKMKDHNRHHRFVASNSGPMNIGRTALGLGRVQAAVLWPEQPGNPAQSCDASASMFLHFLSAGIPTVAFASPAVIDAAVAHGYPLIAGSMADAMQLLQQVTVNPELRRMTAQIGLEIAQKHRPQSAADRLARRICQLKNISVTTTVDASAKAGSPPSPLARPSPSENHTHNNSTSQLRSL